MIIGYARVSTPKQLKKGSSLQDQVNVLKKYGCQKVFKEQYTGAKANRPEFNKVKLLLGKGDTLVIARLDRLARNMTDMLDLVRILTKQGVNIKTLKPKMEINNQSTMGRAYLGMMATFSQLERDMIHDRMEAGKEFELENGNDLAKGGRPSRVSRRTPRAKRKYKNYLGIYNFFLEHKHLKANDPKYYAKKEIKSPAKITADTFGISRQTVYNVYNSFKYKK